jgi:hypothetical protein
MDGPRLEQVLTLFRWIKDGPPGAIPIEAAGRSLGRLQAVTWEDAGDHSVLQRLTGWSRPETVPGDRAAVRRWLVDEIMRPADRLLFWVQDTRGEPVGLLGLDLNGGATFLSPTICGDPGKQGLIAAGEQTLDAWLGQVLGADAAAEVRSAA